MGEKNIPDPVVIAHRMDAAIPAVEIAHNTDPMRIRSPHREGNPVDTLVRPRMSTHRFPKVAMSSLTEKVDILLPENRPEGVRVAQRFRDNLAELEAKGVAKRL